VSDFDGFDGLQVKHTSYGNKSTNAPVGEVTAVLATYNTKDLDNDVLLPGSVADGTTVVLSSYNHESMVGTGLPVGRGKLRSTATELIMDGHFWIESMPEARSAFAVVKEMGAEQPWSWGYKAIDHYPGELNGERVRYLAKVRIFEASPVIQAASIGSRTLSAKHATPEGLRSELAAMRTKLFGPGQASRTVTVEELRRIRDSHLGSSARDLDEGQAVAMREFMRWQHNQFRLAS
jgi:hypothetical protein